MSEKKISKRKWAGNPPTKEGWEYVGTTDEKLYGVKWMVFMQEPLNQSGWRNIKICACGSVEIKANYRSAWNGERLAKSRDIILMRESRPGVEHGVLGILG